MQAMSLKDANGQTPLHFAADGGHLDQVPKALLTAQSMSLKDANGLTPLHFAARESHLDQVPKALLTIETMTIRANDGWIPLHWVAFKGQFNKVPQKLLTLETMTIKNHKGETPLHWGTQHLDQLPQELLTLEMMSLKDNGGWTPLHWAAYFGDLGQVPKELLTKETMTARDNKGYTPLHSATRSGQWHLVPKELLTPQMMTLRANDGRPPLYWVAYVSHLDWVPPELLTRETMTIQDNNGETPLHLAASKGQLNRVPEELLTRDTMTIKDKDGWTPLHAAAFDDHLNQVPWEVLSACKYQVELPLELGRKIKEYGIKIRSRPVGVQTTEAVYHAFDGSSSRELTPAGAENTAVLRPFMSELNLMSRPPNTPRVTFGAYANWEEAKRSLPEPTFIYDDGNHEKLDPPEDLPEWYFSVADVSQFATFCTGSLFFHRREFAHLEVQKSARGWNGTCVCVDVMLYDPSHNTIVLYREAKPEVFVDAGATDTSYVGPYHRRLIWLPTRRQWDAAKNTLEYLESSAEVLAADSDNEDMLLPVLPKMILDHPHYISECNQKILKAAEGRRCAVIRALQVDVERLPLETQAVCVQAVLIGPSPRGPKFVKSRYRQRNNTGA